MCFPNELLCGFGVFFCFEVIVVVVTVVCLFFLLQNGKYLSISSSEQ